MHVYSTLKEITHLQDVFDKQHYVSLCTGTDESLHGRNIFALTYYVYSVVLVYRSDVLVIVCSTNSVEYFLVLVN